MKRKIIIILTIFIMLFIYKENKSGELILDDTIRLRVIPNSNSAVDQNMKIKVKKYLEDNTYNLINNEENIDLVREKIKEEIPNIENNIKKIFTDNNYNVDYKVNYGYNYFPKKKYANITYDEGYYESLVISIGRGEGDNWWCFLFPNLCLADTKNTDNNEYKSWLLEKVNKLF